MDLKDLLSKIKKSFTKEKESNKKILNLVVVVLIGTILMMVSSFFKSTSNTNKVVATKNVESEVKSDCIEANAKDYEIFLQNELKNKLEKINGVGRVEVMIYFESGEEKVPAVNMTNSDSVTNEEDTAGGKRKISQNNNDKSVVITNESGDNKPLIIKKNKPKVTGVLVVAEGSDKRVTELRISKAVCALFNLPCDKVNVYPMKN